MKLLDLFCGAGGAAMGYHRAGFSEIVGVDIVQQPRYPFTFFQGNALEYLARLIESGQIVEFDAIHASPPCQGYSRATKHLSNGNHPNLVEPVRELLKASHRPYVMENVPGAPLENYIVLCGTMFGLPLIRHRLFECEPSIYFPPATCQCSHLFTNSKTSKGQLSCFERGATAISVAGNVYRKQDGEIAMGIDWMTRKELSQAIPPAYTEWIGKQISNTVYPNLTKNAIFGKVGKDG